MLLTMVSPLNMSDVDTNTKILRTIQSIDSVTPNSITQYGSLEGPVPGVVMWEVPLDDAGRAKLNQTTGVSIESGECFIHYVVD